MLRRKSVRELPELHTHTVDPVCGMQVSGDSQYRHPHDGSEYLFCSAACRDKFQLDPARYLSSERPGDDSQPPGRSAHTRGTPSPAADYCPDDTCDVGTGLYTCPMHPDVRRQGPGTCPKCGMALERVSAPAVRSEYVCPMHPEVVQDRPGSCPKCGMALEPRTVAANEPNEELLDMSRRFWVSVVLAKLSCSFLAT